MNDGGRGWREREGEREWGEMGRKVFVRRQKERKRFRKSSESEDVKCMCPRLDAAVAVAVAAALSLLPGTLLHCTALLLNF